MCFAESPFAGFFENYGQLSERMLRLGFPVQVSTDVHSTIELDCDADRKQRQDSSSAT
jgi:hypothetical protein